MTAVAYLRRSHVDPQRKGAISHEEQLAAVQKLAAQHGDDPKAMVVLEDWGKSGRASRQAERTAFAELEEMVANGQATALYSYSLSRLARSIEVLDRLAHLCAEKGVPIRCADGYSPDVSTATGRMVLGILGSVHQWSAEWTAERAAEGMAIRRARGEHIGPAPFGFSTTNGKLLERETEDPTAIVAAYAKTRNFQAAARLLDAEGIPTREGRPWEPSSIRGIIRRVAPELLPLRSNAHRPRQLPAFRLSGLLRCRCGATLSPKGYPTGRVEYGCKRAWRSGPTDDRPVSRSGR